ncbi:hypothetical protein J7K74_01125 [Candidatus Woesearchaeota archaeon]|nr:hypothetical protein [Candidatus Woesearchaeota archaeon]
MVPRIEFRYSLIYQEEIHLPRGVRYDRNKWIMYSERFIEKIREKIK